MDNAQVVGGLVAPPLNTLSVNGFEGENQSEGKEVAHGFWFRNFNKRTMISETHNIDCMEFMSGLPDGFFDLVIADPPYGINRFKKVTKTPSIKDVHAKRFQRMDIVNNDKPSDLCLGELFRVSKNQIIWGANNFSLPPSEYFCIWNKHQYAKNFASAEYAWVSPSLKQPALVFEMGIHAHNSSVTKVHPTQKPVALYKWLLTNYAKPGQKIFDPMMGSQSSRIAAYDMGFDYYGCELDREYFEQGEARFKAHAAKPTLFAPKEMYQFEQVKLFQD